MATRNGKKVVTRGVELRLDTTDPNWFVLRIETGHGVARQSKQDAGRRFRQGTNPDYEGYLAYPLEYMDPHTAEWVSYDHQARKGELLSTRFLMRIASSFA
jgi:hypothetical protein